MVKGGPWTIVVVLALALLGAHPAAANIDARVDRTQIDTAQDLTLTITINGEAIGDSLDFSDLETDWVIDSRSHESRYSLSGSGLEKSSKWNLKLTPKRAGTLVIPSFSWQGIRSQPLTIEVAPPSAETQRLLDKLAYIKTSISSENVLVQEQILYSVRLFYAGDVQLIRGLPKEPELPDAVVQSLGTPQSSNSMVDGEPYGVTTLQYAIFPQTQGTLVIPPETLSAYVSVPNVYRSRKRIEVQSSGHSIRVQPKPPEYPDSEPWLPATDLVIAESWKPTPPEFSVGLPVIRTLSIRTTGLPTSLLPESIPKAFHGAKIYPDPPREQNHVSDQGVTGSRAHSYAIVPTEGGVLEIPEVRITWWDLNQSRIREAVIPASSHDVATGANIAVTDPGTNPVPESTEAAIPDAGGQPTGNLILSPWAYRTTQLLALAAAVGWLLALALFMRAKATPAKSNSDGKEPWTFSDKQMFRKLAKACAENDAARARTALAHWIHSASVSLQGHSLEDLIHPDDHEGRLVLELLNQKLYRQPDTDWDGKRLLNWVSGLREKPWWRQDGTVEEPLPPLYPEKA